MNKSEYAAHRGVSRQAIYAAINDGRITPMADGKIDSERADLEWVQNTDSSKQRGDQAPVPEGIDGAKQGDSDAVTLRKIKLQREATKAQVERMAMHKLRGDLIEKDKMRIGIRELAQKDRDMVANFSNRYGAQIASELGLDPRVVMACLDTHLRSLLTEMSEKALDL